MPEVPQRQRVFDDLKGLIKGEVLFDELSRVLYSTDASIFQVKPLGTVIPLDEADVQATVEYAAANQLALVPRGAGTGYAGESLGTGLIVDLSRSFRSILEVGQDFVRAQPGVVCDNLNLELAKVGRRLGPDPASGPQCTIGGMAATNASGARLLRHGYMRDHVLALRVVLDTGEAVAVGREPRWPPAGRRPGRKEDIVASAATLLERNEAVIRTRQPRTPFNRCGYLLQDVLHEDTLDLHRLLIGSEGTLAIHTELTLRTIPLPADRSVVLLGFERMESALRAVPRILPTHPSACDLLDQRLVTLARGRPTGVGAFIPAGVEALLLVEYESEDPRGARRAAADLASRHRAERLAPFFQSAVDRAEVDRFWEIREMALPSLFGLQGGRQPVSSVEDLGVPPEELPAFVHRLQELLQRHQTTASFLIHAGTGQVHTRPFLDLRQPDDVARLRALAEDIYTLTLDSGGTISSQHGTGLARTPWVEKLYGPLFGVFRDLKAIFDPRRMFNPGKIVGPDPMVPSWPVRSFGKSERPDLDAASMRPEGSPQELESATARSVATTAHPGEGEPAAAGSTHQLLWQPEEMRGECLKCNGCGSCRTEAPAERMCPIFRAEFAEAATPRAKANLLRSLLDSPGEAPALSSDEVRVVADLCVNCKMCALECPARVNVPKLMLEAKAANVAEHGMKLADWMIARTEGAVRLGSAFALLSNLALNSRSFRWILDKVLGISHKRRLPTFARRTFLARARKHGWTQSVRSSRPRVAYFVDIFADCNDPTIGLATVSVLHHLGIEVHVPPGQRGCGMAALANGDVESAREALEQNLRALAESAREGCPIVCSEPTAALMLSKDSLDLVDSPDARVVAENAIDLSSFLLGLYRQGRMRTDFQPLDLPLGHHVPCHVKALGRPAAGPALLSLIPGLRVDTIDVNCSGMAGTFGLKAENLDLSLKAGEPMLRRLASPRVLFGSTECSACRMQMEHATGKRTLHPVQYLAIAYGLMPELLDRLRQPVGDRVL
jgi:FAD/FMN-containing dehydrogenase/Fe-S oxidoreductase